MFFSTDDRANSFIIFFPKWKKIQFRTFSQLVFFSFHFDIWCFSPTNDNFQEELQDDWFLCLILCSLYQFYHTFSFQWFWWWHLIYSCEQAIHCIADRRFRESPRQPRIKMNPLHIWSWFWIFCFFVLSKEAYSHGGLQTRKLGQTPLKVSTSPDLNIEFSTNSTRTDS